MDAGDLAASQDFSCRCVTDRPKISDVKPTVLLRGISRDSPLGRIAAVLLTEFSGLAFDCGEPPKLRRWRRAVGGTTLQWWSGADSGATCAGVADLEITLDLYRQEAGRAGRIWCIVDAAGVPLFHPFHALGACRSAPYVTSLNLIESEDGGSTWLLAAEAHVSSARSYRDLLDVLGRTSMQLIRMALRARTAPLTPWVPGPPPSGRPQTLLRAHVASGLAWLQARISGEVYGIAVLDRSPEQLLQSGIGPTPQWIQIPASEGFIADPFFWPGRPGVILCETYLHRTGLGQLTALSIDAGRITAVEPVPLGVDRHLSYPSSWLDGERVLCLPEMAGSRRQLLYELKRGAAPTPLCVVSEDTGMADPTLMKVNDLYWITYTDTDVGTYDNLCLLYADRLEGPWQPHPGNPVKIDARSSRPGGTPFWVDNQLFRPAQDCSREYGGALVINRVKTCTPEHYQEETAAVLNPDPNGEYPDGLHTLSLGDDCALIDGKRISYHPLIVFHKLRRYLTSAFESYLGPR